MRTGQLSRRITIQRPVTIEHPVYGPQEGGWENVVERIAAEVRDDLPSRTESVDGELRMSDRPGRVRVRYNRNLAPGGAQALTSDMRILLHEQVDQVFQISSAPAEIGFHEWIEFTVRAYSS